MIAIICGLLGGVLGMLITIRFRKPKIINVPNPILAELNALEKHQLLSYFEDIKIQKRICNMLYSDRARLTREIENLEGKIKGWNLSNGRDPFLPYHPPPEDEPFVMKKMSFLSIADPSKTAIITYHNMRDY